MYKTIEQYFKNHAMYSVVVHVLIGVGVGMLLTYPLAGEHPVRWGVALLVAGVLGHLYPLTQKH